MYLAVLLFFLGLIVGSAINSFLWRYQEKISYRGRSMCPACKKKIEWYDNIPLISWLILSGKCRHCGKKISLQYPTVEVLTAVCFTLVGYFSVAGIYLTHISNTLIEFGRIFEMRYLALGSLRLLLLLAITTILIIIAVYDYKTQEIPNEFNITFLGLSSAYLLLTQYQISSFKFQTLATNIVPYLISAIAAFLFFYAFVYFSKETWMGGGDAKMAFGMGLLLGPGGTFLAILLASVFGSIYGLTGIVLANGSKKGAKKDPYLVPFGPFLALGTFISMIFGVQLIDYYVKIILGI